MELENRGSQGVVIRLNNLTQIFAGGWVVAALLLWICFFLTNYSMSLMNINGPDMINMYLRGSEGFQKIFEESSTFMMVTVPILYMLLALGLATGGILVWIGKGKKLVLPLVCMAGFCFIYSLIGSIVIGRVPSEAAMFIKLIPQPAGGYYFALIVQLLAFGFGIAYLIYRNKRSAPSEA